MIEKIVSYGLILGCISFFTPGCSTWPHEKILPKHDEVLTYNIAYDLTYLRTVEALENVEDWELEETEKEKGTIKVRNTNYKGLMDKDQRTAVFILKRINRKETSVQLAPDSQRVIGGDILLTRISEYLNREIGS